MKQLVPVANLIGNFGNVARGENMIRNRRLASRLRVAVSIEEVLQLLDQNGTKLSKQIGDLTTLLSIAHTLSLLDRKTEPVLSNLNSAIQQMLDIKSALTTSKLYLQKLQRVRGR